jgi:uncharacterized protein with PIN domain
MLRQSVETSPPVSATVADSDARVAARVEDARRRHGKTRAHAAKLNRLAAQGADQRGAP